MTIFCFKESIYSYIVGFPKMFSFFRLRDDIPLMTDFIRHILDLETTTHDFVLLGRLFNTQISHPPRENEDAESIVTEPQILSQPELGLSIRRWASRRKRTDSHQEPIDTERSQMMFTPQSAIITPNEPGRFNHPSFQPSKQPSVPKKKILRQ